MRVLLSSVALDTLARLAHRRGESVADVIARAISHERFIDDVQSDGGNVLIEDRRGNVRIMVPK